MPATEQPDIANLLSEAGAAHGVYEEHELNGVYDLGWPAWYAAYLVEHRIGDLLGTTITTEQLAGLLAQYDREYRTQQRQVSWPDYYAAQLLEWRNPADDQTASDRSNRK
jgi:hypothetical protein